jgi:ATP synthase protein I
MSEGQPPEAWKDFDARLRKAQEAQSTGFFAKRLKGEDRPQGGMGFAVRIGVELVSAVAVGTAIGWGLDYWLGTRPWLMLVFILLGGAAGMLNVYKMASGMTGGIGYRPVPGAEPKEGSGDGEQGESGRIRGSDRE